MKLSDLTLGDLARTIAPYIALVFFLAPVLIFVALAWGAGALLLFTAGVLSGAYLSPAYRNRQASQRRSPTAQTEGGK